MAEAKADTGAPIAGESVADAARRLKTIKATQATANAEAAAKFGSTAGKGLGGKEGDLTQPPAFVKGEDPKVTAEKWRKYRAAQAEAKEKVLGGTSGSVAKE